MSDQIKHPLPEGTVVSVTIGGKPEEVVIIRASIAIVRESETYTKAMSYRHSTRESLPVEESGEVLKRSVIYTAITNDELTFPLNPDQILEVVELKQSEL